MSVLVVGGINLDVLARSGAALVPGTSNPGQVRRTPGGVARNVAEGLARLGEDVVLAGRVGPDADAAGMLADLVDLGVDVSAVRVDPGVTTGSYVAVLDADGTLLAGVADMDVVDIIGPADLPDPEGHDLVVLDGNLATATLDHALRRAEACGVPVVLDPVGTAKAARLASLEALPVHTLTPNADELAAMGGLDALHARGVRVVWVRHGAAGSTLHLSDATEHDVPAVPTTPVDVTGAGDAMLAAYVHRVLAGDDLAEAAAWGSCAASLTVAVEGAVRPDLDAALLTHHHRGAR